MFKYFSPIKFFKRRGQVLVFYALVIPILFFFAGVGLDLGWYYLNVSRLQNAADAAVLAGARTLTADTNFKNFTYGALVDKYPADNPDNTKDTTDGDQEAAAYVLKNLSSDSNYIQGEGGKTFTMKDNYTRGDNTITMKPSLYQDAKKNFYYVVHLSENIHHFFLGSLDDMNATVVAVTKLTYNLTPARPPGVIQEGGVPEGTNILAEMYKIEDVSVTRNWEWQNYYIKHKNDYHAAIGRDDIDIYGGKWNEYQAKDSSKNQSGIKYEKGKKYRTETADVFAGSGSEGSSTGQISNNPESVVDSLNLDFKADIQFKKKWREEHWTDFDVLYPDTSKVNYVNGANSASANLRIHATFNFEKPFAKRAPNKYNPETNPEDVLYARIESEPIEPLPFKPDHTNYNSVRQIILNINQSNMGANDRPLMIFYAGPETINEYSSVRESQPIILNLNADARVILFAPNSPVIINGNGYTMQGFVVAKEFIQLTTLGDYNTSIENGKTKYFDKNNPAKEYFLKEDEHGNNLFTDEYGNVQTKSLDKNAVTRDPDYITQLKNDTEHTDYLEQLESDELYLWHLLHGTEESPIELEDSAYAGCLEMPERADVIGDFEEEKIYDRSAFNLSTSSYYDSFRFFNDESENNPDIPSLKRRVYTYLDNYATHRDNDPTNDKPNSVDMFFTTTRAGWID